MTYSKKILLADDDCDDVEFFTTAVKEITPESEISIACDGFETVDMLRRTAAMPEIIFLDINMPKMDGIDALTYIRREIPGGEKVPVIIYSTSDDEHFIRRAYDAGANCYFKKPFSFQELKACISNFLQADWSKTVLPYEEFAVVV
ncbi:MAG: response regulator [Flavobacterium sp.]